MSKKMNLKAAQRHLVERRAKADAQMLDYHRALVAEMCDPQLPSRLPASTRRQRGQREIPADWDIIG